MGSRVPLLSPYVLARNSKNNGEAVTAPRRTEIKEPSARLLGAALILMLGIGIGTASASGGGSQQSTGPGESTLPTTVEPVVPNQSDVLGLPAEPTPAPTTAKPAPKPKAAPTAPKPTQQPAKIATVTPSARPKPTTKPSPPPAPKANCDPSYPDVCIPPGPPDLNCPDVSYTDFRVVGDDPHGFDRDGDGIGCES